jgi:anti-sigma B factor antagonist
VHLKIEKRATQGVAILACHGRIMFGDEANLLRSVLRDVLATNRRVVVDLADVNHLDSGGLGMLVGVRSSAKADGAEIKLSGMGQRLRDVLQITKLATVFDVYDTEQQAIESFGAAPA